METDGLQCQQLGSDDEGWQSFVSNHDLTTPFHTLAWKRSVETTFDYRWVAKVWRRDETIVAFLPLFECPALGRSSLVNPFCEYGFPLLAPNVDTGAVFTSLSDRNTGTRTLLVKEADWTGTAGYNAQGFGGASTGTARRLSLDVPFEVLRTDVFDRALRKNVDTARAAGVDVVATDECERFYSLYVQTMQRRGSPQFPRAFISTLRDQFGDDCSLLVATLDGRAIAGLLALDYGEKRHLFLAGSDEAHWDKRPNDLLYFESVRRACHDGYDVVDFGRSAPGSGVDRFKARFGGTREHLTTLVVPPHRATKADISSYRRLEPVTRRLAPLLTHSSVGPRLKTLIHE